MTIENQKYWTTQPLLPSPIASVPQSQSPTPPHGGSSKSKTISKGSRPRGSKRKAAELVEEPMDKDILVTDCDPPVELTDPINSIPPREVPLKCIHLGVPAQTSLIKFVPPAVKAMSSSQANNSSFASPRVLILNDSFHMILDYKARHNKWQLPMACLPSVPSTYDGMFAFLSEVHIQLFIHSIRVALHYSQFFLT